MRLASLFLSFMLLPLLFSLPSLAQSSPLSFKVLPAPAPNRYTAENSVAWNDYQTWVGKAMDAIENSKGNIGDPATDPTAFLALDSIAPRHWTVSGHESWRGQLNPTGAFEGQYGNAVHFVLHVKGDGTVRFKYEDISWCVWRTGEKGGVVCNTMALTRPHSGGAWDRVDCTYGWGYDWGADNKKGGGDDSKVCGGTQTSRGSFDSTLVDELFYVGASFASAADYRYNKPSEHPNYVDWTLQQHFDDFCQDYNTNAGYREIGLEFTIIASDSKTYNYVARRPNAEFGRDMQPTLCIPYPPEPAPAATATPVACTGEVAQAQGFLVQTQYGLCSSGVQIQQRDASAVGIQSVLDAGFIDAVDVWGKVEQTVTVCFPYNSGSLVFLDATITPRVVSPMQATMQSGKICGTVNGPGLIVLVESWGAAASQQGWALSNCLATTSAILNFRDGPAGSVIGLVPANATLTAVARTDLWFKVDYHGSKGWISAEYVDTRGSCD